MAQGPWTWAGEAAPLFLSVIEPGASSHDNALIECLLRRLIRFRQSCVLYEINDWVNIHSSGPWLPHEGSSALASFGDRAMGGDPCQTINRFIKIAMT